MQSVHLRSHVGRASKGAFTGEKRAGAVPISTSFSGCVSRSCWLIAANPTREATYDWVSCTPSALEVALD